ncbi:MAG: Gfo/Idh/MocA family oxidoreductase, partial [Planctomycetaceae bacterium]|nr:Gfo/Idh/MocA family oxidoreductase [Planctomycetaceae bacterium]
MSQNSANSPSGAARRGFLKTTAAVAAGSMLTSSASAVPAFHVAGRDVIKIGLVGCGGRGTGAATNAMNTEGSTELVAVADAFEGRLKGCLEELSKGHPDKVKVSPENQFVGFDAYKGVLASDADLIILTTPPGFRPLHFEAAVNAGKHIFMEKPVATDAAGVRRVLAANEIAKTQNI